MNIILFKDNRGQLLLEILIVIGIIAIVGSFVSQLVLASLRSNKSSIESSVTGQLARETFEAVTAASFSNWQSIDGLTKETQNYYATTTAGAWTIATGTELAKFNGISFSRYFSVSDVCRDASMGIVATGTSPCTGLVNDPSTKKINVSVGYSGGATTTISQYLTRWRNKICNQTGWTGAGSGTTTCPSTSYGSKNAIDTTGLPGSLKLQPN